jgi:hypothetical protein
VQTPAGKIAFPTSEILVTERERAFRVPEFEAALKRLGDRTGAVFFIPTKYRTYYQILGFGERLPNAQWEYLKESCGKHGLRCIDLTPPLVRRSKELIEEGRFTFWEDDTHWNAEGIKVAAKEVYKWISAHSRRAAPLLQRAAQEHAVH